MNEYYFLFALGLIWIVFASIQDLRKREVANWLNFSLIAIALAYRAIYSLFYNDWEFFALGLAGFAMFFAIANAFYYTKVFAGGDAKLLMGIGCVLPFESFFDFLAIGIGFVFILFLFGAVYSLFYSLYVAYLNGKRFSFEFKKRFFGNWKYLLIAVLIALISFFVIKEFYYALLVFLFVVFIPLLYVYLKAVECCMIKLIMHEKLTEGDWIEQDVRVNGKWIRKNVHGLSLKEIELLRKYKRRILVKEGIPFVPSFLFAFAFMVYAFLFLGLSAEGLASWLPAFFGGVF